MTATGTLNPVVNVTVGCQVSGRISKLYVDFNSAVNRTEVIAEIDPSTYEAQLLQSRANLANQKANLALQQANEPLRPAALLCSHNILVPKRTVNIETPLRRTSYENPRLLV